MSKTKLYLKIAGICCIFILIWYILFSGTAKVLHIIMSDNLYYSYSRDRVDGDSEMPLGKAIAVAISLGILTFVYNGYRFYRDRHWGFHTIDRDKIIYNLEKSSHVSHLNIKDIDPEAVDPESELFFLNEDDLREMKHNIKYIEELVEQKKKIKDLL